MKLDSIPASWVLGAGVIAAALLYVRIVGAAQAGQQVGGAVVDFTNGVLSGAVVGAGQVVGVPATNETECDRAMREGRTWDASFACPAGTFLKYLWN